MSVALTAARILIPSRVFGGSRVKCLPPPTPIATQHSPSCFFPPSADLLCFSHFICCLSLFSCNENARVANPSFRNMAETNSQASKYDRFLLLYPLFFCHFIFLNCRILALQNFVLFCQTSTRISHRYTHVPSAPASLPSPSPSHPSGLSESSCLSSLSHTANSHWLSILHMVL